MESSKKSSNKQLSKGEETVTNTPPIIDGKKRSRAAKLRKELIEVYMLAGWQRNLGAKLGREMSRHRRRERSGEIVERYRRSEKLENYFKKFDEALNNYLENNPKDFITRGALFFKESLRNIFKASDDGLELYELMGKGLYYDEDLNDYEKAIEYYKEAVDKIDRILLECKYCVKYKFQFFSGLALNRIEICENKIKMEKNKK